MSSEVGTNWQVYMIRCSDDSLYTGITVDVEHRFRQHLEGRGAKYFRSCRPLEVVYLERGHSRISASRREVQIKRFSRAAKTLLLVLEENEARACQPVESPDLTLE